MLLIFEDREYCAKLFFKYIEYHKVPFTNGFVTYTIGKRIKHIEIVGKRGNDGTKRIFIEFYKHK